MTEQNELKTSEQTGLSEAETPVKSPVRVPALSFDREAFLAREMPIFTPDRIVATSVYVMRCERFVKIGISNDVAKRHRGIQGAVPFPVTVACKYLIRDRRYAWLAEQECHRVLAEYRTFGEWFDVQPEVAIALVRQVVPAARRLMELHNRVLRDGEREKLRRYQTDAEYRAMVDRQRARDEQWLEMDRARHAAMAEAAASVEQAYAESL